MVGCPWSAGAAGHQILVPSWKIYKGPNVRLYVFVSYCVRMVLEGVRFIIVSGMDQIDKRAWEEFCSLCISDYIYDGNRIWFCWWLWMRLRIFFSYQNFSNINFTAFRKICKNFIGKFVQYFEAFFGFVLIFDKKRCSGAL